MKKFLAVALGIFLTASNVSAEQPKAQEYREILSSEKFYVEYEDEYTKKIIVEEEGRRMTRIALTGKNVAMISILNPLANLFGGGYSKFPNFMYYKDKYYKFNEKDSALMIRTDQLNDVNLNPNEGWSLIDKELSLPDELAIFNWHDKHHKISNLMAEPTFANTLKKSVDGKEYTCDRYESEVKNSRGEKEATIIFDMCYNDKGELALVQSAIFANGKEYGVNKLTIKKILREIPKGEIILDKNAKIYAAGIGDMNDLLENPVLLGKLSEIQDS
ncbi:MAG: hypothetical protein IJT73_06015 [Selenomonadaceae bacterium]|nr:hypothetical protein [Selenomonadaceae bacterium]